jgi:amino acid adenylation domain-containing protein
MTYADLDAAANRLALRLREAGAGRGTLVAVCAERSPELLAALLAVLKAGAAYLPLDPDHPVRRQAMVIGLAANGVVLAHARVLAGLPAADARVVLLDPEAGPPAGPGEPAPRLAPLAGPADLAYVIHTSGSTGRPKGVEVEHRSLVNVLMAMRDEVGGGGAWLAMTSIAFDIAALELFLPLVTGGRVVLAAGARDGGELLGTVRRHGATHVQATPSGWRALLAAGFDQPDVVALAGGEPLPLPLARELRARCRSLVNVYGPTETTVWSTISDVPPAPEAVTIGRPIANTVTFVMDDGGSVLPAGLPGELLVGGAGVARGYRGRAGETAGRFVPSPFGPPGSRLYRTGDRVRMRTDGLLEFLGRADEQVKVRGHRVELGEVEAGLLEHPAVAQAAAALRADGAGEPCLVAYVVPRPGARPAASDLRRHLGALLPEATVPTAFVTLERLPLTPNGKLDRRALPEPPPVDGSSGGSVALGGLAGDVHAIWREVLRIDHIGPDDNLFEIGGHSLTATLIVSRIRKRLKVDVPLHVFYDEPTIAGIVRAVADRASD